MQLVSNAATFTDGGTIEVRSRADAGLWVLEVEDSGPGIAPERIPHLFDPFGQEGLAGTSRGGGTGLGLTLCDRTVRALAGRMEVESVLGQGSLFRVTLPIR